LLFVGRIQPLKGADVAVKSLAALNRPDAKLLIVGGASGAEGDAELANVHSVIQQHGLENQVRFVEPQQHHILSTYYRAADVVLVPSRSESFGLVALEAAACGTPVVANAVGGLLTIVEHGRTGFLVADRQPDVFARHIAQILDDPALAARMSSAAAERARGYTWSFAAARLRRAYADLTSRDRVECQ
jgi:D-inositol-3-phosphate glycosyltransferase